MNTKLDEDRLLTEEEIKRAICSSMDKHTWHGLEVAKAQVAKGMEHEQARVERIFREIEKAISEESYPDDEDQWYKFTVPKDWWQALWEQEGVKHVD